MIIEIWNDNGKFINQDNITQALSNLKYFALKNPELNFKIIITLN